MQRINKEHIVPAALLPAFALLAAILPAVFSLTGCGLQQTAQAETGTPEGIVSDEPGIYDSADTAVLLHLDTQAQQMTLKNRDTGKEYTLTYDGTTCFYDQYGMALSAQQLGVGEVVDLTFYAPKKRCNTLQQSTKGWSYEDLTDQTISSLSGQVVLGGEQMELTDQTVILSDGQEITPQELSPIDHVSYYGIDNQITSIVVDNGHGYLRLKNEEYFYGGWIEVGDKVVQKVTENMMLTVPEGSQQVILSNKGTSGTKQIQVVRGQEVDLDVGDLKGKEPQYGTVLFTITPSDANLYLDGTRTDYGTPVKLEYGIHQMIVRADGYDTVTQYLRVGQPSAGISVDLKTSSSTVSGNDTAGTSAATQNASATQNSTGTAGTAAAGTSGTTAGTGSAGSAAAGSGAAGSAAAAGTASSAGSAATSTQGYQVTVEAPTGAEVYLDGNYIGIAPCSFAKDAGGHSITLRKTGYVARSYTIQVDQEQKNISYSFPALAAVSTN